MSIETIITTLAILLVGVPLLGALVAASLGAIIWLTLGDHTQAAPADESA